MRTVGILLIMALVSCAEKQVAVSGSGNFTGYEMVEIAGSNMQYAVKKDGNGAILEEGSVLNGQKSGTWITYHQDDKRLPATIASYSSGILNGPTYKLNDRGQIEEITPYLNNELHGRYGQYKFGRPTITTEYKNGKYDGLHIEYFNTGGIQKSIAFKEGVQDGKLQYFDEAGNVTLEYEYKDGEKVSGGIKGN